jgi:hypothetical protein
MVERQLDCGIIRVEESYRIRLPQSLLRKAGWITGERPLTGWLLVGSPGRCRLLSAAEVENDPSLVSLRARIAAELNAPGTNALEFHDAVLVALTLRLLPVQITPPDPGWRLTIPRPIAAGMQVRPGESDIAAIFFQGHIEFWTIETLRAAETLPLTQIL